MTNASKLKRPQIKICGLTDVQEACDCAALGADAIGCIFYPKSPRHVTDNQARDIVNALPSHTAVVGVFVNTPFDEIMKKVDMCGLTGVQLHGQESPDIVDKLREENLLVIKALFEKSQPDFEGVSLYHSSAYLVECGIGKLPGGNALSWNWGKARSLSNKYPLILAGGIDETNVTQAINEVLPDAIDISSGVEISPGRKNIMKVKSFISKVTAIDLEQDGQNKKLRRIFNAKH